MLALHFLVFLSCGLWLSNSDVSAHHHHRRNGNGYVYDGAGFKKDVTIRKASHPGVSIHITKIVAYPGNDTLRHVGNHLGRRLKKNRKYRPSKISSSSKWNHTKSKTKDWNLSGSSSLSNSNNLFGPSHQSWSSSLSGSNSVSNSNSVSSSSSYSSSRSASSSTSSSAEFGRRRLKKNRKYRPSKISSSSKWNHTKSKTKDWNLSGSSSLSNSNNLFGPSHQSWSSSLSGSNSVSNSNSVSSSSSYSSSRSASSSTSSSAEFGGRSPKRVYTGGKKRNYRPKNSKRRQKLWRGENVTDSDNDETENLLDGLVTVDKNSTINIGMN